MLFCSVDQVERDSSNKPDFVYDNELGWLHHGADWHTVGGSPVGVDKDGKYYLVASTGVPTPSARPAHRETPIVPAESAPQELGG